MQSNSAILAKDFDESFQRLLLRVSEAASSGVDDPALIELFCQSTRKFFQVDAVYFWQVKGIGELVCTAASGVLEAEFRERTLRAPTPSIALDAVRSRRTVVVNYLDRDKYPLAAEAGTRAIMAAPLVVCNDVIGALAFVHNSDPGFFNDDMGAKATILAGQLGSLLEAARLSKLSREEHRRSEILADVAQALNAVPDVSSVIDALANRIRGLLRTRVVCILMKRDAGFELLAVAVDTPQTAPTGPLDGSIG